MSSYRLWANGDLFTKVGAGIFGGSIVALYYNYLFLKPDNRHEIWFPFVVLVVIAIVFLLVGYSILEKEQGKN